MKRLLPFAVAACLVIGFRVLGSLFPEALPNFQPLAALWFCGVLLAPGWRGLLFPALVWALTFPLGSGHPGGIGLFATTLAAFLAVFALGHLWKQRPATRFLAGSVAAALLFHLITGTAAWVADPLYPKTAAGLWQSLWTGRAGSPLPSWVFLRNLAAAHLLFTGSLLLARHGLRFPGPGVAKSAATAVVKG